MHEPKQPLHILRASKTYNAGRGGERVRRRRDLVAKLLDDNYLIPKGESQHIAEEVCSRGFPNTNVDTVNNDAAVLRNAWQFLGADETEQAAFREKVEKSVRKSGHSTAKLFGVWCLMQDNITNRNQAIELKRQYDEAHPPEESADEQAEEQAFTQLLASMETETPDELTAEAREDGEALDIWEVLAQATDKMAVNLQILFLLRNQLGDEHEADMRRIKTLARQNEALRAHLGRTEDELRETQEEITRLRRELEAMESRLRATEKRKLSELLEQTASQGTEGRQLYVLAQRVEAKNAGAEEREKLRSSFPDRTHDNRNMEYEERFLRDVQRFPERFRQETEDALWRFAEHGERYSSLKTDRWNGAPPSGVLEDAFESRVNDEYRILWKQIGIIIYFYRAGRHTDFSSSER